MPSPGGFGKELVELLVMTQVCCVGREFRSPGDLTLDCGHLCVSLP